MIREKGLRKIGHLAKLTAYNVNFLSSAALILESLR